MSGIYMLLGTLIALGVLVTIHEYGHFWVARRCGVRVLRFSVGFGKPLFIWKDKQGTEFAIAAIPLGGYVKMLDGRESPLSAGQESEAFNLKPVRQRMAVVAAGPAANFLLAFVFFWALALLGTQQIRPVIGQVVPGSLAEQAGLQADQEIVAIDGQAVQGWGEVNLRLLKRLGESGSLQLEVRSQGNSLSEQRQISLNSWQKGVADVDPISALGIEPWRPAAWPVLNRLSDDGPARAAGLQVEDRILSIDGQAVDSWYEVVALVQANPGRALPFVVERAGQQLEITVPLATRTLDNGVQHGFMGASGSFEPWPEHMLVERSYGLFSGALQGLQQTWTMSSMTLMSIKKMLLGELSAKNLSGPISIAKVAGASAESGLRSFLHFMAYLSISLGVLNLLPVPVLDGGHLLFYTAEWIRGRPLSERIQAFAMQLGMAMVLGLMVFALFNDIARL